MRVLGTLLLLPVFLALLLVAVWGGLAVWFRLPAPEMARGAAGLGFLALGIWAALGLFGPRRWGRLGLLALVLAPLLAWWASLSPARDATWSPEVARQVTGTIEGDILTLENARDFTWRSESDLDAAWITLRRDLSQLESLDLLMSYWAGPSMAHLMLSFGFADGRQLVWSTEVRRVSGTAFSPVADAFKSNPLAIVAGTERDIVGLRTNAQGADVVLYRLNAEPAAIRRLLEGYVARANALAERPEFFHSLLTNCSRSVITLARGLGAGLPADWRVLVNGYFPEYLYELGALDTSRPFAELRALGAISGRARAHGLGEGFSQAIREGIPPLVGP